MLKKFNLHSQHVQTRHTVTDYCNSNCQSNPINSTLDAATAVLAGFNRYQSHKINFPHHKISYSYQNTVENIPMERS